MAKDPALLLYTKDWIEGTGEMSPSEKGVYIDLLAHQHQKGDLPSDTSRLCRLVSLSENDFLPIWETVHKKFELKENGRLHNRRLTETVAKRSTKRSTKSHTNSITGRFAVLIRSVEPNFRDEIKKRFKIDDFNHFSTETATERLTEWFAERLTELENATILINNNSIVDSNKEVINNLKEENKNVLENSNLFRQPKIPTKKEVLEVFDRSVSDKVKSKEMARAFWDKYEGLGWFIHGSPIVNFASMANKFITNWNSNNEDKKYKQKSDFVNPTIKSEKEIDFDKYRAKSNVIS